ncbi:hypothetical protein [Alistipes sp.]|uniref:hypothetical protein n=1 Tax=Alistipes sp. TaxID=1872444 RepID=UPI003AB4E385
MKKLLIPLLLAGSVLFAGAPRALAQRGSARTITTTKLAGVQETFDHTEAFHLEAGHEMLVTPLVATVKVLSKNNDGKTYERATFTGASRQDIPSGLAGNEYLVSKVMDGKRVAAINVELLKAQVTYDFCRETGADMIVVPQFNIRHKMHVVNTTDSEGNPIKIEEPIERDGKYVMIVDVVGFPAVYTGFREGTRDDEWIKKLFKQGKIENEEANIQVEETLTRVK